MYKIAVIVGSLRKESLNLKFANALSKLGKDKFEFKFVDLKELPIYNDDLWPSPPNSVTQLKSDVAAADAVLMVTPEYNRSMPALTKNVVDWVSRPHDKNAWANKLVSIVGTSPGGVGTAVAQSQLRSSLLIVGAEVMGTPEIYLTFKPGLIDDQATVTDESTRKFLERYLTSFETWISKHKK